jgi:hypothetical protein
MTFSLTHWKVLCAVSLGINFLFAGLWLGRRIERRKMPPPHAAFQAPRGPWHAVVGRERKHEGRRGAAKALSLGARAALDKEPFDPQALEQALEKLREDTAKRQEALHGSLVEVAKTASPEERRELARTFAGRRRGPRP